MKLKFCCILLFGVVVSKACQCVNFIPTFYYENNDTVFLKGKLEIYELNVNYLKTLGWAKKNAALEIAEIDSLNHKFSDKTLNSIKHNKNNFIKVKTAEKDHYNIEIKFIANTTHEISLYLTVGTAWTKLMLSKNKQNIRTIEDQITIYALSPKIGKIANK